GPRLRKRRAPRPALGRGLRARRSRARRRPGRRDRARTVGHRRRRHAHRPRSGHDLPPRRQPERDRDRARGPPRARRRGRRGQVPRRLTYPRVLAVGDAAVTVELGSTIDADPARRVRALDSALRREPFGGFREAVPTYRSLLVMYDPAHIRFADVRALLLARAAAPETPEEPGRLHRVPVVYG